MRRPDKVHENSAAITRAGDNSFFREVAGKVRTPIPVDGAPNRYRGRGRRIAAEPDHLTPAIDIKNTWPASRSLSGIVSEARIRATIQSPAPTSETLFQTATGSRSTQWFHPSVASGSSGSDGTFPGRLFFIQPASFHPARFGMMTRLAGALTPQLSPISQNDRRVRGATLSPKSGMPEYCLHSTNLLALRASIELGPHRQMRWDCGCPGHLVEDP